MIRHAIRAAAIAGLLGLAACATVGPADDGGMLSGDMGTGFRPASVNVAAIAKRAQAYPLGSKENPVRAQMPPGQRAYLSRLRCADGRPPGFFRVGNFGAGIYQSIIDGYQVTCAGGDPAQTIVYIDMYHPGYVETRAVPGFTIVAP